jgi:hypothetical protein
LGRLRHVTSRSDAASPGLEDCDAELCERASCETEACETELCEIGEGLSGNAAAACANTRLGVHSNPAETTRVRTDEFLNIRRITISWMRRPGSRCAAGCPTIQIKDTLFPLFIWRLSSGYLQTNKRNGPLKPVASSPAACPHYRFCLPCEIIAGLPQASKECALRSVYFPAAWSRHDGTEQRQENHGLPTH